MGMVISNLVAIDNLDLILEYDPYSNFNKSEIIHA